MMNIICIHQSKHWNILYILKSSVFISIASLLYTSIRKLWCLFQFCADTTVSQHLDLPKRSLDKSYLVLTWNIIEIISSIHDWLM